MRHFLFPPACICIYIYICAVCSSYSCPYRMQYVLLTAVGRAWCLCFVLCVGGIRRRPARCELSCAIVDRGRCGEEADRATDPLWGPLGDRNGTGAGV